jgi:glycosyltransferase involved in cell wall biosynthesis
MPALSVIICCHNSMKRLPPTLEHLALQKAPDVDWEVVVVDNASTDQTSDAVHELWKHFGSPAPLVVVREEMPGLSHARLRGMREARYDTLGFVDDDNWLNQNWVDLASRTMDEVPEIGLLGTGNIEPEFEAPVPDWVLKFAPMLACGSMTGAALELLDPGSIVAGAGMVTRKPIFLEMLREYGGFASSDRRGTSTASGGDIEFAYVASILGWRIARHPLLRMQHFIPNQRTRPDYLFRLLCSIGQAANLSDALRRNAVYSRRVVSAPLWYSRLAVASLVHATKDLVSWLTAKSGSKEYARLVFLARIRQVWHLFGAAPAYCERFAAAKEFKNRTIRNRQQRG